MDGNNERCLPDGRKGIQSSIKIENVKKKIHARPRKMLWHKIGNFVWASGSGRGEVRSSCKKFSRGRRGEQKDKLDSLRHVALRSLER